MGVSSGKERRWRRGLVLQVAVLVLADESPHGRVSLAFAPRSITRADAGRSSPSDPSYRETPTSTERFHLRLGQLYVANGKAALSISDAPMTPRPRRSTQPGIPNNSTNGFYQPRTMSNNEKVKDDETLDVMLQRQWQSWYSSQGRERQWSSARQPRATANADVATEQQAASSQKIQMLALLWLIACVSALDRVAMSIALLPMGAEFGLTDAAKGSLSSFFSLGYGIGIVPAGLLVSKGSPKVLMSAGLALWSLATLATPLAATSAMSFTDFPLHLLLVRAAVGMGESVILPAVQRLLSQWITMEEKAGALATVISGFHAGTLAAYVLSPIVLEQTHTWRGLFDVYGGIGIALLLPWWLIARDAPHEEGKGRGPAASVVRRKDPLTSSLAALSYPIPWKTPAPVATNAWKSSWDSAVQTFREAPWKELLNSKSTWALVLAHSAKNWGLYNALSWTPTFYAEQYDLNVRDSAMFSVLPSVTGAVCVVLAGSLADFLGKQLGSAKDSEDGDDVRAFVRKSCQVVAFGGQGLVLAALAAHIPDHAAVAQAFLMATYAFTAFNAAGFESGIQDKAGTRWSGLLYSVTSLPAVLVGTAGVYATGRILDATNQGWSYVYGMNSIVCLLGAAAFVALYDSKRELE